MLVLAGCASPGPEAELETALQAAREAARDTTGGAEAIALLEQFVNKHPANPRVADALMQLGMLRQQHGDIHEAIAEYERIVTDHGTSKVADQAQFMIAFIREDILGDYDGARAAYQAVIDNYPTSELAAQARTLRDYVGQDPDDYITFEDDSEGTR